MNYVYKEESRRGLESRHGEPSTVLRVCEVQRITCVREPPRVAIRVMVRVGVMVMVTCEGWSEVDGYQSGQPIRVRVTCEGWSEVDGYQLGLGLGLE